MKLVEDSLYNSVLAENSGVTKRDVKKLLFWYNLLSCALPFQIIFIIVGFDNYAFTMCSVLFVFLMDAIIKDSLERDGKNFIKLNKHIPIIKLWVVPLVIMAIVTTIVLVLSTFGLI